MAGAAMGRWSHWTRREPQSEDLTGSQWAFLLFPVKPLWKMHGPRCGVGGDSCTMWLSRLIRCMQHMRSQKLTELKGTHLANAHTLKDTAVVQKLLSAGSKFMRLALQCLNTQANLLFYFCLTLRGKHNIVSSWQKKNKKWLIGTLSKNAKKILSGMSFLLLSVKYMFLIYFTYKVNYILGLSSSVSRCSCRIVSQWLSRINYF